MLLERSKCDVEYIKLSQSRHGVGLKISFFMIFIRLSATLNNFSVSDALNPKIGVSKCYTYDAKVRNC